MPRHSDNRFAPARQPRRDEAHAPSSSRGVVVRVRPRPHEHGAEFHGIGGALFERLGHAVYRRRWAVLVAGALLLVGSILVLARGGAFGPGTTSGIESEEAEALVARELAGNGEASFTVLFHAAEVTADDPRFAAAVHDALAPLRADPRVRAVTAPDAAPPQAAARLVAPDGHHALALVTLRDGFREGLDQYPALRALVRSPVLDAAFTGQLAVRHDLDVVLESDLRLAELVSLPLALVVLLWVFRTFVAAALPVVTGALAVLAGIAALTALSHVMDVAVYAINITSLIGLGVAIDYSLFLVSRYRDERASGLDDEAALARALETAGSAVAFSGLAVAIGLGSLLFFRGSFLATMGLGAALVVALSVVFALTVLPALLAVLGPWIDAGRVPLPRPADADRLWHRIAAGVMRRPVAVLVPTLGLLLTLGTPFLHLRMAAADVRTLPRGTEARETFERLRGLFPAETQARIPVVVEFPSSPALTPDRVDALDALGRRLRALPGVAAVESPVDLDPRLPAAAAREMLTAPPGQRPPEVEMLLRQTVGARVVSLSVVTDAAPAGDEARALVRALRADRVVGDGTLRVAGAAAHALDLTDFIRQHAPKALAFVVVFTCVVLFALLRSIVLPLKAVVMNLLSITASFGALVFLFQDGHFAGLLGIEPSPIEPTLPVLLFCTVFGLSMDYEVLLLARMREVWLRTHDNRQAVAEGLARTGRLVTSAAAIMVAVFVAFGLARVVVVKAMGLALALAVLLDATVVRVLVVPATMRLFGDWNWWAPAWLGSRRRRS
ncbi:MAG: MMPL family transporter [Candidatus Binatia bacterium]